ncbi:MAG: YihA family ribosome biogenesis GTP-binding protein [Myxococcales bacterium]|nr:YihA family ribosome biogenesis GTP-binding protein [Myxococcales bacterium]
MAENPHVRSVRFVKSAVHPKDFPDLEGLPEVAIAGRSNVGKSSLINGLVNRKRLAKVSSTPGRTQLLNFFVVNEAFALCDLPGYGYAKVPLEVRRQWGPMIETYLAEREALRGLLLLVDARREPGDWEQNLIGWCSHHGIAVVPVVTKIDKLSPSKRQPALAQVARGLGLSARQVVGWSATSGEGLEHLWKRTTRLLGVGATGGDAG